MIYKVQRDKPPDRVEWGSLFSTRDPGACSVQPAERCKT